MPGLRPVAQSRSQPAKAQKLDEEYKRSRSTQDPRISTELVDHLPASDDSDAAQILGRMPGTPGELTYAKDIQRYYEALDKASDRITMWTIGKTEEGRDMVLLAVADEATIKQIDKCRACLPRSPTRERRLKTGPAADSHRKADLLGHERHALDRNRRSGDAARVPCRLAVEETPFIQAIRNNVITLITPVIEVDGREKASTPTTSEAAGRRAAPAADVLGQVSRTTTIATAWVSSWR
jgi:hypothetical protein